MGTGSPPAPWANLIAEFMVSDYDRTFAFWTNILGFTAAFARPAQRLACLTRPEGAQIMFYERDGDWETGSMEPPFGRGAIIQVFVGDANALADTVRAAGLPSTSSRARSGATGATVGAASASFWCRIPTAIW